MNDVDPLHAVPELDLPPGWSARPPGADDVPALAELATSVLHAFRGEGRVEQETVAALVVGSGSWTRRQLVVLDADDRAQAWASVHDRAAGRTMVDLTVRPDLPEGDRVAAALLAWMADVARAVAVLRQLGSTQLDASPYAADERLKRWLTGAGYAKKRTWLHLTRPVDDADGLPGPREGVVVRRVAKHDDGQPVAADIQVVHLMLEESFADHFNSYRESFPEFVQRLREDPGHRWDHWWVAEVEVEGQLVPGGALVASVLGEDASGHHGSYVEYIGVHRRARGRGVAKALLHTVIKDAHERGRNRVDLEVDADSPTGADGLYTSMGWTLDHVTESWHGEVTV
ncbi:GNAT family N-acetyltransferase [Nocardioides marmoribigeumensis]|uniref:GNAT superfamily N-acetyltransferase n=1 Tax=Nocardioides marmoribigeumensis TaxID=433649 RepID=A0ABU2C0H0_9ACTN|nr:GNAT family N-acetyltransferase [Nocardioides marmoribigeumensis]MDR7364157.1 GNAT superfamily N-acetyltransferase [Nocardioides marmoribigeumensis]